MGLFVRVCMFAWGQLSSLRRTGLQRGGVLLWLLCSVRLFSVSCGTDKQIFFCFDFEIAVDKPLCFLHLFAIRLHILWLRSKKGRKECRMTTYHLLACLLTRILVVISLLWLLYLIHLLNWGTLVVVHLLKWVWRRVISYHDESYSNRGLYFKTKCIMRESVPSWIRDVHSLFNVNSEELCFKAKCIVKFLYFSNFSEFSLFYKISPMRWGISGKNTS